MVLPTIGTSQPPETSGGNVYLKIIEDAMVKFIPTGKVSEVFSQIADKFREKEEAPTLNPLQSPTDPMTQVETSVAQSFEEPTPISTTPYSGNSAAQKQDLEEGEEIGTEKQGDNQGKDGGGGGEMPELVEEKLTGKDHEVVAVEEEESEDYDETLSERATRRSLRVQRRLDEEESKSPREETVALAAAKKEAAERSRKGKQVATTSKKGKLHSVPKVLSSKNPSKISLHLSIIRLRN